MGTSSNFAGPAHYQPRNVVNAPQIKEAIVRRSARRNDGKEIRGWLANHFFRWCVGNFPQAVAVDGLRNWRLCLPETPPPAWFQQKVATSPGGLLTESLHYVDPEHPRLIDAERVMLEFLYATLGGRLEGKLHKITYFEALERWQADHARMLRQRQGGWAPSSTAAFRVELATPSGRFVEFASAGQLLRAEMAYESFYMQHCVGDFEDMENLCGGYGDYYAKAIEGGKQRIFSLRDEGNRPHVTVSLVNDFGEWRLEQVKGKQNQPPAEKYWPDVVCLLNHLQLDVTGVYDCAAMGLITLDRGPADHAWGKNSSSARFAVAPYHERMESLEAQHLLARHPQLIRLHPAPALAEQWLCLGGHPWAALDHGQPPGTAVAAASLLCLETPRLALPQAFAETGKALPLWLAAAMAEAEHPPPIEKQLEEPSSTPRRGWLSRLLGGGAPPSPRQMLENQRMRWALAVADLLYLRQGIAHYKNAIVDLGLPAQALADFRQRIAREVDLPEEEAPRQQWIEGYLRNFFEVPYFEDDQFMAHCATQGISPRDLLAFAATRQTFLLRALTAFGDIAHRRAALLLRLNAQRIQDCFTGWRDFALAYASGRGAWVSWKHGKDVRRVAEVEAKDYLDISSTCNWHDLPWRGMALVDNEEAQDIIRQRLAPSG